MTDGKNPTGEANPNGEKGPIPIEAGVLSRNDTKALVFEMPMPGIVCVVLKRGESTDMDLLELTTAFQEREQPILVMDSTEVEDV